jgi:sugar phosphate isomerase/epimerase
MIAEEAHLVSETLPFMISLGQWSLHRRILGVGSTLQNLYHTLVGAHLSPPGRFRGDLDPLDFPRVARREFGIGAVEFIGFFYAAHLRSMRYMRDLKDRCDGEGVRGLVVACGAEGALGDPDANARSAVVQRHLKWLDMAAYLGCHAVSVRVASSGAPDDQARFAADGLRDLGEWAQLHGLHVLVENHDGPSSDGAWLARTLKLADRPNVGASPDWGNFDNADEDARYDSLQRMMPFARAVTAKCYDFDRAGNETTFDFPRLVNIATTANYHGHLSIEYEGSRLSEADGVRACKVLLERIQRGELRSAA